MDTAAPSTDPESAAPARPRLTADDRRAAILTTARATFARRGFFGTGTAEIAAAAGCSEPTLYKHFPSKQALFAAVVSDCGHLMKREVARRLEGADDQFAAYAAALRSLSSDPTFTEVIRVRSAAVAMMGDPEIAEAVRASVHGQHDRVRSILEASQALGTVRQDIDADAFAWITVGVSLLAGFRQGIDGNASLEEMPNVLDNLMRLVELPKPQETTSR